MRSIEAVKGGSFRNGIIQNMPREEYREACGLNPSSLKKQSPLHIKHAYENQGETTDPMRLGTAVHTLCWEPHRFTEDIAVWEGDKRGKAWTEFREENEGKTIIKLDGDYGLRKAESIVARLTANPLVRRIAEEGVAETAVFTDEHGLQCRGLLDWVATHLGWLVDLKVVADIQPRQFGSAVQRYGWDVSMACYRQWFQREANKELTAVKFIAVESKPPFDVAVINVDDAVLDQGWRKAQQAILSVRDCIETGLWPGIAGGDEMPLYVPAYAMDEELVEFSE